MILYEQEENKKCYMNEKCKSRYVLLGDTIKLSIIYNGKITENQIVKLVDYNSSYTGSIPEVSIFSPIGKAIYLKEFGKTTVITINNTKAYVLPKEKVIENNEKMPQYTLKRYTSCC